MLARTQLPIVGEGFLTFLLFALVRRSGAHAASPCSPASFNGTVRSSRSGLFFLAW